MLPFILSMVSSAFLPELLSCYLLLESWEYLCSVFLFTSSSVPASPGDMCITSVSSPLNWYEHIVETAGVNLASPSSRPLRKF